MIAAMGACVALAFGFLICKWLYWRIVHRLESARGHRSGVVRLPAKLLLNVGSFSDHPARVAGSLFLSAVDTLQGVLVYWCAAEAVQLHLTISQALLAGAVAQLSVFVAFTPAGIGITESAFVAGCIWAGSADSRATSAALLVRIMILVVAIAGGALYMHSPIRRRHQA
jgi:uncharacterized membrane protein YbhN (UPF0104 family)